MPADAPPTIEEEQSLAEPRIVAIGGGTGMPALLRGLTPFTRNITAIVTVADDGGSSGRLRRELNLFPPGDFRGNIAALSHDEALMTQLLDYRFGASLGDSQALSREVQGHAFGNLLLAALAGITGSFDEALLAAQRVLAIRGQVVPSTVEHVRLEADILIDDASGAPHLRRVAGESKITGARGRIERVYLDPVDARAYPPALKAIFTADLILIGPGSLYTSILPNLLVSDLNQALVHARAPKIYVCNVATQPGETDNYSVADHVRHLLQHIPAECIDCVLANNNFDVQPEGADKTVFVKLDQPQDVRLIAADLVDEGRRWRHDSNKLAKTILSLLEQDA